MIRLATLGMSHEANTFAPTRVTLDTFGGGGLLRGEEIVDQHRNARSTMAGYLDLDEVSGVSVTPLLFANVTPAGEIESSAFESIVEEMATMVTRGGPWDGMLLALHGAAVAEHCPDADGEILRRMRGLLGPNVPIGVAADLHANVSEDMIRYADVLVTYQTNPHIDARERAFETGSLVLGAIRGDHRLTMAAEHVPAVLSILSQNTDMEPMRSLLEARARCAARPGVLSASVAEGYPYADVAELGMTAIVVTDGDAAQARQAAQELAQEIWARRHQFSGRALGVSEAVGLAIKASSRGPVLLLDVGDNIGAGAPGDSTTLVAATLAQDVPRVFSIINDPVASQRCLTAGPGARCRLELGADRSSVPPSPLEIEVTVESLHDGQYHDGGHTHGGQNFFDTGPSCLVSYGDDCLMVITSKPVIPSSLVQLRLLGVDAKTMSVIIAKGVNSPLIAYGPLTVEHFLVDTPGITPADSATLPYVRRRQPLYPFEDDATLGDQ